MESLFRNIRVSLRQLRRQPAFAAAVILTLGLAIAANTAIFSFVNALLIRPFPFRDSDQLVLIRSMRGGQAGRISMREVLDIKEQVSAVDGIAAHTSGYGGYNYSGEGRPQEWTTILTTGNLFEVLGVPLAVGAKWPDHDDRDRDYRVILSHGVWRDSFGGRSDVWGKKITLDHAAGYTIDGVAGRGFDYPHGIQVYRSIGGFAAYDRRAYRNLVGVARIKRSYSMGRLQAELDGLTARLAASYPDSNAGLSLQAISFRELYSGDVRSYLLVLLGAVGFVLLIACANVANLQLSRALGRSREMGVRIALGAGGSSLIGQLLTESVVLTSCAGLFGVGMAFWWIHLLRAMIGVELPEWMIIGVDGRVLMFTAAISLLAAVVSGLAPALQLSRQSVFENLKQGSRGASGGKGTNRLRDCLVVAEIAVALILLAGAGLLVRGFLDLRNQDKGFRSESISTFRVALGWKRYIDQPPTSRYYERALDLLAGVPGFETAGFVSTPPLTRAEQSAPATVQAENQSVQEALSNPYVSHQSISENYFQLIGIPLREGRFFNKFDTQDAEPVAVVSARLAKTLWGSKNAIGQRVRYDPAAQKPGPLRKIVGVVGDVQVAELGGESGLDFYVPYRQQAESNQYVLVKTRLDLREFTRLTEQAMWSLDPEQSVFDFATYDQRILGSVWQLRISRSLLILFSGVALVLAIIGIYGVTSYVVGQRRRELGIRLALGASPKSVRMLIVGRGVVLGSSGLAIGVVGAGVLGRILEHMLRGVSGIDSVSLLAALTILFAATVAASAVPAWRASRMDPVIALREE